MAKETGVSFRTKDAVEGGGLWPEGGARLPAKLSLKFGTHTFKKKDGSIVKGRDGQPLKDVPCLIATFDPLGAVKDKKGKKITEITEPYGVGKGWKVSKDGSKLIPQNGQTGLSNKCGALQFLASLEEHFPEQVEAAGEADDITEIKDLDVLVYRKPKPKDSPTDKDSSIVLIAGNPDDDGGSSDDDDEDDDEVEARASKGKAGKKAAADDDDDDDDDEDDEDEKPAARGKKKAAAVDDEDDDEEEEDAKPKAKAKGGAAAKVAKLAAEAMLELLGDAPKNKLKVVDLPAAVKAHVKGHPDAKAIVALVGEEDFLETEEGWNYTGTYVSQA